MEFALDMLVTLAGVASLALAAWSARGHFYSEKVPLGSIVISIVILVIDEQHADELLADIDLGGIVLLRPRHDADLGIAEYALQIRVELSHFLDVHGKSPIEI